MPFETLNDDRKPVLMIVVGRQRVGKTTFLNALAQYLRGHGASFEIWDADKMNATNNMSLFHREALQPTSVDPEDVKAWLEQRFTDLVERRFDAMLDVGGGDTPLARLVAEVPIVPTLEDEGVRVVVVHVVGPDLADLDYLDRFEQDDLFALIQPPPSVPSSRDRPFPATTPQRCAETSPEALWSTTCERADDRGAKDSAHRNRPCRSSRPRTSVPDPSPLPCRRGAASPRSAPLIGGRSKMANERRSEVPTGPRDLELKDHIREVEKAAADWGVHVDALEGRFIGALLAAIRESGRTNLAVLGDIEALLERARATGEGELRRIGLMIEASQRTLSMAQEAAETSAASGERAERVFNASVAKIAKDLSVKLLDECQQWLVLKQTQHNRRDARRLAVGVAAAAIAVFVGGYAMAGWRQDKETKAEQAVVAAVQRCWKKPVTLHDSNGGAVAMCRLQDLLPKQGGG